MSVLFGYVLGADLRPLLFASVPLARAAAQRYIRACWDEHQEPILAPVGSVVWHSESDRVGEVVEPPAEHAGDGQVWVQFEEAQPPEGFASSELVYLGR